MSGKKIGGWLKQSLKLGLGGKTSSGYGLGLTIDGNTKKKTLMPKDKYPLWVELKGKGVSPLLRSGEPEFRPNLFKATLRGHVSRLLAGVSNDRRAIENKVNNLFGCTDKPGDVELYWQSKFGNVLTKPIRALLGQMGSPPLGLMRISWKLAGVIKVDCAYRNSPPLGLMRISWKHF